MSEEQPTLKAKNVAPDAGPYDPDTNPDGYLPLPAIICRCGHYEDVPWYRDLLDRIAGWFR